MKLFFKKTKTNEFMAHCCQCRNLASILFDEKKLFSTVPSLLFKKFSCFGCTP